VREEQAVRGDRVVREEQAVRGIVGEPVGTALATVVFKAVPGAGVEIGAPSAAAVVASAAAAPGPAAAGDLPAWAVREAVVRGAVVVAGDNLSLRGANI
jgi:hypothetical protein